MLRNLFFLVLCTPLFLNAQTAYISGNDTVCDNANVDAAVMVDFSGSAPFTFIYSVNGANQPSITTTVNPYVINTSDAGTYTLQSYNDAISVGTVSGSAIVTVLQSPTAIIHLTSDTLFTTFPQTNFFDQSVGNIVSWSWYFGDNSPIDNNSSVIHTFPFYVLGCMDDGTSPTYPGRPPGFGFPDIDGDGYGDSPAINYNPLANTEDGSCCYTPNCTGFSNPCLSHLSALGFPSIYQTALIVQDINGCSDTATHIVSVNDEFWMYIPTSFTPDLDGINDKFCIEYSGIRENTFLFKVYNAQGGLMYQSTDPNKLKCSCNNGGWNGTHYNSSEELLPDTYVYEIYFQDLEGWKHREYGNITLIK